MSTQKQHDTEKLHDAVQRQVIEGLEQGQKQYQATRQQAEEQIQRGAKLTDHKIKL